METNERDLCSVVDRKWVIKKKKKKKNTCFKYVPGDQLIYTSLRQTLYGRNMAK